MSKPVISGDPLAELFGSHPLAELQEATRPAKVLGGRVRTTQASYERIIKAAAKFGRVATSANHYPDGRVEFVFSALGQADNVVAANPWDE